ncbi:MAG: DUF342 domain-containing protein [Planctomycetes bacterium]|nr:DUF342 domain-containing protein [Planctomycetota bacterium]
MTDEPENIPSKVLSDEQTADYHILLLSNDDSTCAYLRIEKMEVGCELGVEKLQNLLDKAGVVYGIDTDALKDLSEKSAAGILEAGEELFLVAAGKPAQNSCDGRVDYMINPSPVDVRFVVEGDDNIDYKNTNLIQNVMAEQALATLIQPQKPVNGVDIFGNNIVATEGQPIKIKLGPGTVMDQDKIFAQISGRFIEEDGTLSVSSIYQVRGDVDYTIGNVNFVGTVQIQKDVLDDFSVYAKERLEVGGVVGAANMECDGEVLLNGGINGKGKGFVRAQKKITAKYMNEVTVVGREDVEISKHAMNCMIKTKGKVLISTGSIIGGEVSALLGIDAAVIGSNLGTLTSVVAGLDFEVEDRVKSYEAQLLEMEKEMDRINRTIGPILKDKAKLLALPAEKKRALKGLLQQVKGYKDDKERIQSELASLHDAETMVKTKEIHVRKMLYSGVRVTIGHCKRIIKMEVKGPVRLTEDLENDTISITNLTL